ncbi:hypothetical protein Fmac_032336 [Flemingia macrophylla]|uniref:Uncharacterized protein n=1 Tax=Flemingia macrophylla TaxID=520843 RepID=A0ABD1L4M6_9FABA
MGGMKKWCFFKRLRKESWRAMKLLWSAFNWQKLYWPIFFMDYVIFKIMFAFETIMLLFMLSFFFLCCGCKF